MTENETKKPTEKKNDYNFDLRIILLLLLSIVKINIFDEKRIFFISYR